MTKLVVEKFLSSLHMPMQYQS